MRISRRAMALTVGISLALCAVALAVGSIPGNHSADANGRNGRTRPTSAASTTTGKIAGAQSSSATVTTTAPPAPAPVDTHVRVFHLAVSRPIPSGFVGLSIEYGALLGYAGHNAAAMDPIFEQLIRNLAPGQSPVIRIGGNSTDTTWWPIPGQPRARWMHYTLSPRWLAVVRTLASDLHAHLILGLNLEAGNPQLAAAESHALIKGIGASAVQAFEPGNEPTRYTLFPWYRNSLGTLVWSRPRDYGFAGFNADFTGAARLLPAGVALAGPTLGGDGWLRYLPGFLAGHPDVKVVTVHHYPLNRCFMKPGDPMYATLPRLLSRFASRYLTPGYEHYIALTHAYGDSFRIDEMNSVACGGKPHVSDVFASALWAVDALFRMVQVGVDGVNIHTFPRGYYKLFTTWRTPAGQWRATVRPEYYGLMLFAHAAPPGSRLLAVKVKGSPYLRVWATSAGGTIRLVLINVGLRRKHTAGLRLPPGHAMTATLERLTAPSVYARRGVKLAGASFGKQTTTGKLVGAQPEMIAAAPNGTYRVTLGPGSAALLTIPAAG